ncbi:MAG: TonB-dependent receptor, partial [Candidatus Eremiobacteraeota bacterium]|nr:TonB-dependent receptor [Candidatus Eremiobacteraeota bacterium]
MTRTTVPVLVLALFAVAFPSSAAAQSSGGTIAITVTDAKTKSPVPLARVLLDGPILASEVATSAGKVTFTDAPAGIYRARVFARGYRGVTSAPFEMLDGERVTLDVALAPSSDLRIIAVVHSVSSVRISTNSIDSNSAQRKLSGDLADALSKLSGVSITSSSDDSDAAQTISLDGHDASQTAMTLDGIPMNAPGSAGDLRMFATDLFTGASVHHGPQIGGLGGGVDFRTLEPTLSWQSQGTLSTGSNGRNNESLGISGSLGNLGIAAMSTTRTSPSLADGMHYLDASGLDYEHEGGRWVAGDLLKANLRLPGDQTLAASFINSTRSIGLLCLRVTAALPCGYGPGNNVSGSFSLYSLGDQLLTGATAISTTLYGTVGSNLFDLRNRFIDGVAAPAGSSMQMRSSGFTLSAELPAMRKHTLSILAYDTNSSQVSTPLVASNAAYYSSQQQGSYGALQLSDRIRANDRLALNASLGLTHASYSGGSALGSVGASWRADANDSYALSYALSGSAPNFGRNRALSDPASLQFDCQGNQSVGYGGAPGDQPGASSSSSLNASVTHRFARSALSLALYRQVQSGVVLPTQVNGSVLLADGTLSPSYIAQVQGVYASQAGCGVGAPP